jgi:hypothetical protein
LRHAAKRDIAEPGIVATLKAIGCDVERGTDVDLFVGFRGVGYLIEIKTPGPSAKRLRPLQKRLQAIFKSQYHVVKDSKEALIAIGYYAP